MGTRRQFTLEQKIRTADAADFAGGWIWGYVEHMPQIWIITGFVLPLEAQFEHRGKDGLLPQYKTIDPELRAIQQENERLKRIVADQALELAVKTELLKKTEQLRMQGRWQLKSSRTKLGSAVYLLGVQSIRAAGITDGLKVDLAESKARIRWLLLANRYLTRMLLELSGRFWVKNSFAMAIRKPHQNSGMQDLSSILKRHTAWWQKRSSCWTKK